MKRDRRMGEHTRFELLDLALQIEGSNLSPSIKQYATEAVEHAVFEAPLFKHDANHLIRAMRSLLTVTAKGKAS